jgi:hypothetical protein
MTERDVVAIQICCALISSGRFNPVPLEDLSLVLIANTSYDLADAILHSRKFGSTE